MKKKITLFLFIIVVMILIGALSYTTLLSTSESDINIPKTTKSISKSETYKSKDTLTHTQLKLDYKDSTYTYQENLILKPGYDLTYERKSKGRFKMDRDTLIFYSEMPANEYFTDLNLTDEEIAKNKFSYIYPIAEKMKQNLVKIYFDNIAEIEDYNAFTVLNNQLKPMKIIERKKMEEEKLIRTKNDNFFLFHYLIIEKPKNNMLLITGSKSESFLFDFNKIPYQSFHFFIRVYGNFLDFTALKFQITPRGLKKIPQTNDDRYSQNQTLNSDFIKQK